MLNIGSVLRPVASHYPPRCQRLIDREPALGVEYPECLRDIIGSGSVTVGGVVANVYILI